MDNKIVLLALLLFGPAICCAKKKGKYGPWSYKPGSPDGPTNWGRIKGGANCLGASQSPVDINTVETVEKEYQPLLFRGYDSDGRSGNAHPVRMINNGKAFKIQFEGDYLIRGGGLPSLYKAAQMHLHWGSDMTQGSEHTVNGQSYPAEVHIVHYDARRYQTLGDAVTQPQGLAVLGFFIRVGQHNQAWESIVNHMDKIRYKTQTFDYTQQPFRLDTLLPNNLQQFYRYSGSLTTPGCYESVVWTVFNTPIELSRVQVDTFRTLSKLAAPPAAQHRDRVFGGRGAEREDDLILNNYRPVQRLNYRTVYQSFEKAELEYDSESIEVGDQGWSVWGTGVGVGAGAGGFGGTGDTAGRNAGGTGGFNNNYGDISNENAFGQTHLTGGDFHNYDTVEETAVDAGGNRGATGETGETGYFDSYFGQFDSSTQNQNIPVYQGNEHGTAEQGGGNAGGTGQVGGQGVNNAGAGRPADPDPWGGVDGTGGIYGGGADEDVYGDYYGGGNTGIQNGAGGTYGGVDPSGGGGDPYGAAKDPYGDDGDPYGAAKDPYGFGGDPYGAGGDPYGGNGDPYGAVGDAYGGDGNTYGAAQDPFGGGGDPYSAAKYPYGGGGDPYGAGGDPYGGGGDTYDVAKDPYGGGGDPYGAGRDTYGGGGDPYGAGNNPFIDGPNNPSASVPDTSITNSGKGGIGAVAGDSGLQPVEETKTKENGNEYGLINGEEDPYRTGYAGHNGLAQLWQQLINRKYTDQQDAAYYNDDFGVADLTADVPTDQQFYDDNALYDPFENYRY